MWRKLVIQIVIRDKYYQEAFEILNEALSILYEKYGAHIHVKILNYYKGEHSTTSLPSI